jgi:hypothetical protein
MACSCVISRHSYKWAKPAGASLFAHVVKIVSQVADAQEAPLLSREAALKLGFVPHSSGSRRSVWRR